MTIQRKRMDNSNVLVEVETDPTDTVDLGGTSDSINVANTAITAKFSDTSVMQTNSGLKIGVLSYRAVGGTIPERTRSTISPTLVTNPQNGIDSNPTTETGNYNTTSSEVAYFTVDFGAIATQEIFCGGGNDSGSENAVITGYYSTDNSTWIIFDGDIAPANGSYDLSTASPVNYRYVQLRARNVLPGFAIINVQEVIQLGIVAGSVSCELISSTTQNGTTGTVLDSFNVSTGSNYDFSGDILLTDINGFVTLKLGNYTVLPFPVNLSLINSITEV